MLRLQRSSDDSQDPCVALGPNPGTTFPVQVVCSFRSPHFRGSMIWVVVIRCNDKNPACQIALEQAAQARRSLL
jgi:hypothetical protein